MIYWGAQLVEWAGNACWSELTCLERVGGASWQIWSKVDGSEFVFERVHSKAYLGIPNIYIYISKSKN